ncbi:FAD-binding monooxygenase [Micromonospora sp. DSM 115977]|uniref:FAD-binding monooxygenase n=1 Tax=Micromonospora reichwaldensis TaxID=3075516 RepID=A0ABU2X011_9ACTN|nr:FAD-dependent oxidoreductase [Micromonospora sp. DSM 115977]MDT0531524.1 FAD-binding monooxygenase [Micromonospora sp. DSM 115977]
MSDTARGRAVVLGASMAGLFAAKVLAEAYREVVLVDRDRLADATEVRRGAPQGRHLHGLLARGQQAIEELLPGFTDEATAAGLRSGDLGTRIRWYFNGHRLKPAETGLLVVGGYRPGIEALVRRRVLALSGVRLVEDADVVAPVATADGSRITGVRIHHRGADVAEVIDADLVVDATGRGSRTPAWLTELGHGPVPEERIKIGLTYTSARFRFSHDPFHGDVSINPVATPAHPRGAFLATLGGDTGLLSLTGILGDEPPTDREGFLAYAASLPVPDIIDAVRDAEFLDEPASFRFPASVRRRYERVSRLPEGLLVVGDAVCTFNPVYGQGMTVAALEALILRRHLAGGGAPRPRAFFADISRQLDAPWEVAAGGDLAHPRVEGPRPFKVRMANAYIARVHAAATRDSRVTDAFLRVAGLIDPPQAIMRPSVMLRVLRAGGQPAGSVAAPSGPVARPPARDRG